jgi:chorismate lyase / 3-hydroxybenzoate synthase
MPLGLRQQPSAPVLLDLPGSSPPTWVDEWVGPAETSAVEASGFRFETWKGERFSRFSIGITNVDDLDTEALQRSVTDAYRMAFEHLSAEGLFLVRTWAAIPRIHAGHGAIDRYMVFNAGRFAAYSAWLGGREEFSRSVTTASAVGSSEKALQIHGLLARESGVPIDNPRQVPAYRYSRQFGPLPPCFARATLLPASPGGGPMLLVGGTASIVGEESKHLGDLGRQIDETLRNLAAVVASACAGADGGSPDDAQESRWLAGYREIRLYHREESGRDEIMGRILDAFSGASRVELRQAELCRPELLVEIEGVAELPEAAENVRWP